MLSLLWSFVAASLAWGPKQAVGLIRRLQLRRRAVVRVALGRDRSQGSLHGHVTTLQALQSLTADPYVRAVVLDLRDLSGGQASLQGLRAGLVALRAAGKLVVVHLDSAGLRELYLASVAHRVWLTPSGEAWLQGMGAQLTFYGDLLERLGVKVDLMAAGAYKSFGEPYTRAFASAANREQMLSLVGDLQDRLIQGIAQGRNIPEDRVRAAMAESPLCAERAAELGLVDGLAWPDQAHAQLEELLSEEVRPVSLRRYAFWAALERWLQSFGEPESRTVVVHLEGPIVHGAEASGGAGHRIDADRVVPVLDALAKDDDVGAVVLYVNSPGGSALASDLIARSVQRLGQQKPVVAAFGDVSASGGYFLSAPAAEIIAAEGTITGSIGVVGGKLVFGPALGQLGVHAETLAVGPDAGMMGPWEAFNADQRARFQRMLTRTYDRFLQVVSAGRRRPVAAIEPYAQGRVWTGRQALAHGLVDHLGGLDLALERARSLAGLRERPGSEAHIRFPPPRFQVLNSLLGRGASLRAADLLPRLVGELGLVPKMLFEEPERPLLLLPIEIDWR